MEAFLVPHFLFLQNIYISIIICHHLQFRHIQVWSANSPEVTTFVETYLWNNSIQPSINRKIAEPCAGFPTSRTCPSPNFLSNHIFYLRWKLIIAYISLYNFNYINLMKLWLKYDSINLKNKLLSSKGNITKCFSFLEYCWLLDRR